MVGLWNIIRGHNSCDLLPIAVSLCLGTAVSSCIYEYEGDCIDQLPFTIENDWQACPDASPEGIAYIFFPADGGEAWRFDFPGRTAGKVSIEVGKYKFLSYNDDTYNVLFHDEGGYESYEAYTAEKDLLGAIPQDERGSSLPRSADERTVGCPDMMWSGSYSDVTVTYDQLTYSDSTATYTSRLSESNPMQLVTKPRQIVATYSYDIINVKNLSGVKRMCAAMSGLAASLCVNNGLPSSQPVTLPVKAVKSGDSSISGKFFTFGLPRATRAPNLLYLFVWLTDGRRYVYEFDVTEQVVKASDHLNVHVVVDSLSLPESIPDESVGTFDPSVDGWTHVVVNFVV